MAGKFKIWWFLVGILATVSVGILVIRFIFGGDEDTWICEKQPASLEGSGPLRQSSSEASEARWVKHGQPRDPMPQTGCGTIEPVLGGDKDIHGCIGSAGYSWCDNKQKCLRIWEEKCE